MQEVVEIIIGVTLMSGKNYFIAESIKHYLNECVTDIYLYGSKYFMSMDLWT